LFAASGTAESCGVPPIPTFIPPCRPTSAKAVPAGVGWLHEPKLDGYRLQVVKNGCTVRLYTRNGNELKRLAPLADALAETVTDPLTKA
jgi:ATP-dependent DNA ligase